MNNDDAQTYVRASAAVLGLPLDDAQVVRVAAHLQRTAAMARMLDALDLPPDVEQAEIYRPSELHLPGAKG